MTLTNKAITLSGFDMANPTSTMTVSELPIPTPGAGEVVVRITLRPVNPADIFALMGVYPGFRPAEGATPIAGLEGTGTVHSLGPGAAKFSVGQRVVGAPFTPVEHGCGTWQQYMAVPESCLLAVPDAVSDDAAAQFWVNPVTCVGLLAELAAPAGEYILQTAAGSVLGRQIIQVAKHRGIKTINVVRRRALEAELKALGADEVIVTGEEDIAERVKAITGGKGAWGGIDAVGGDTLGQVIASVRDGGLAIIYGAMDGLGATVGIPDILFRGVTLKGFWLMPWTNSKAPADRDAVLQEVMDLLASKVIVPFSGARMPLEEAAAAVAAAQAAARGGTVLLEG